MDSSNALFSSPLTQAELDTLLLKAARDGDTDTVSALISTGANVNAADQRGITPLMFATANGHTNIVSVLIAARAEINTASQYGSTALKLAVLRGDHNDNEIAFKLLDATLPQEVSATCPSLMNRFMRRQPAITPVEAAYHQALAEFRQGLTNMLSALNKGTGRHALGTTNALLDIIACYYAPDWCGTPSKEMNRALALEETRSITPSCTAQAMNRLRSTLTNLANTVTPAFRPVRRP